MNNLNVAFKFFVKAVTKVTVITTNIYTITVQIYKQFFKAVTYIKVQLSK